MKDKRKQIGFSHAWNGIKETFKSEINFRIHVLAAILVISIGTVLKITILEWIAIVFAIGVVMATEMINSVVEATIDYLKPEYNSKAKYIKDAASGAVLISAISAAIIGSIIFVPRIYELLL